MRILAPPLALRAAAPDEVEARGGATSTRPKCHTTFQAARAHFGGGDRTWSTNQCAGMQCGRSPAARLSMARLGVYFASNCLRPFYDLTTDEEANDCICVLAKARYPCR